MQTGKRGGRIRVRSRKLNEKCWMYVNKWNVIASFDRVGYRAFLRHNEISVDFPSNSSPAIISILRFSKKHLIRPPKSRQWLTCIRDLYSRITSLCSQIRVITYKLFLVPNYNSLSVTQSFSPYYARRAKIILTLNKIIYEVSFIDNLNLLQCIQWISLFWEPLL